jgi:hypothetical protein
LMLHLFHVFFLFSVKKTKQDQGGFHPTLSLKKGENSNLALMRCAQLPLAYRRVLFSIKRDMHEHVHLLHHRDFIITVVKFEFSISKKESILLTIQSHCRFVSTRTLKLDLILLSFNDFFITRVVRLQICSTIIVKSTISS